MLRLAIWESVSIEGLGELFLSIQFWSATVTQLRVTGRLDWHFQHFQNSEFIAEILCLEWQLHTVTLFPCPKGVTLADQACIITEKPQVRLCEWHFWSSFYWCYSGCFVGELLVRQNINRKWRSCNGSYNLAALFKIGEINEICRVRTKGRRMKQSPWSKVFGS